MADNNKPISDSVPGTFKATFGTVAFQAKYISLTQHNGRISVHGDGLVDGRTATVSFSFREAAPDGVFNFAGPEADVRISCVWADKYVSATQGQGTISYDRSEGEIRIGFSAQDTSGSELNLTNGSIDIIALQRGLNWMIIQKGEDPAQICRDPVHASTLGKFSAAGHTEQDSVAVIYSVLLTDGVHLMDTTEKISMRYGGFHATEGYLFVRNDYGKMTSTCSFGFEDVSANKVVGSFSMRIIR